MRCPSRWDVTTDRALIGKSCVRNWRAVAGVRWTRILRLTGSNSASKNAVVSDAVARLRVRDGAASVPADAGSRTRGREAESPSIMPTHHAIRHPLVVTNARHNPSHGCASRLDRTPSAALLGHARKTLSLWLADRPVGAVSACRSDARGGQGTDLPAISTVLVCRASSACWGVAGMFFILARCAATPQRRGHQEPCARHAAICSAGCCCWAARSREPPRQLPRVRRCSSCSAAASVISMSRCETAM